MKSCCFWESNGRPCIPNEEPCFPNCRKGDMETAIFLVKKGTLFAEWGPRFLEEKVFSKRPGPQVGKHSPPI